jgi:hypothetical protein
MSFTFDVDEMAEDLRILAQAAARFLEARIPERLTQLGEDLRNAVANAKATRDLHFSWKTRDNAPIVITTSRNWKGTSRDFDPMFAEVSVDYKCVLQPEGDRVLVKEGVSVIRLKRAGRVDGAEKVFHFDADEGGWSNRAGHPALHTQFYGIVNDIPRLPCLIVHPIDVISFVILELHQSDWRDYVQQHDARQKLRHFPQRQRVRLQAIAARWVEALSATTDHGLVILQQRMPVALNL